MKHTYAASLTAAALAVATLTGCGAASSSGSSGPSGSAGSSSAGVTDDAITLGASYPLTGVVSASCVPIVRGAQAWIDKVNSEGGVNGRQIKIEALDDAYQAPKALSNARVLSQKPAFAFFNGCGSIAPTSIQQVAKPDNIPFLLPAVGSTASNEGPNFFTVMPSYAAQLSGLIPWALKNNGTGSVMLVNTKLPDSAATATAVEKAVKDAGGTFLGTETISVGEPDFGPLVLKLKQQRPDYLVFNGSPDDGNKLFGTISAQDAFPAKKILMTAPLAYTDFIAKTTNADERLVISLPTVPWGDPAAKECEDAFNAASPKVQSTGFSLFACASAQLLVQTLKDTGKDLTREGVIKTLEGYKDKEFSPILAPVTFSPTQHTGLQKMYVVTNQGGALKTLDTFPLNAGN